MTRTRFLKGWARPPLQKRNNLLNRIFITRMRLTVLVTNAKFLKNVVTLLHSHYNKNKHNSQSTSNELCCAYIVPIKNDRSIVKTVFLSFLYANLKKSRLKTYGFLRFYQSFLFYPRFLAQRTLVRFSLVLLVREQTYIRYLFTIHYYLLPPNPRGF